MADDLHGNGVGRRQVTLTAASFLTGVAPPTAAQGPARPPGGAAAPPGVVLPLPVPCADRPGDLTGFLLEGYGSPAGTVAVIGQAFRPGDLPGGARLAARTADGRPVPAQIDASVRHADGSVRFGIVSLALPALGRGSRLGVILSRAASAASPPLDFAAALAGRSAILTVTPVGGGEPWRLDLLGRAAAGAPWQSGPLAVQRRVMAEVPAAAAGATSLRVVADVAARADGTLWVDLWLRNDVAMRPGGGPASYSVRLALDGREILRSGELRHFQYTGWGRLLGTAPGGAPPPVQPVLRPDTAYLAETGAIARYDLSTGVAEEELARFASWMAAPDWAPPFAPRRITQEMGQGGGRPDIGPTTMFQAAWLTSGDPRAALFSIGQAESAGAVPWHMWDPRGGWLDERRTSRMWYDERAARPLQALAQPPPTLRETGWDPQASHQPDLAFVPYLLTGRRAFLDELQAQAAWNVLVTWPGTREVEGAARGVNVIHERQVRSGAWAMRQLGEAAWISPDGDQQQDYFRDVTRRNWAWLRSRTGPWTEWQGESHGWVPQVSFSHGIAPWQQDYLASTAAAGARHGEEDARAVLAWMSNFLVGRFLSERRGLPRNDGAALIMIMTDPPPPGRTPRPFGNWARIAEATRAAGEANGTGWEKSQGEYGRLALQTLALLQDVLGHQGARQAYLSLMTVNPPPGIAPTNHAATPTNNIVPRGMPRVPERLVRCTPPRG